MRSNRGINLRQLEAVGAMRTMEKYADDIIECEPPELTEWRERTKKQAALIKERLGHHALEFGKHPMPDYSEIWEQEDEEGKLPVIYDAEMLMRQWIDNVPVGGWNE